METVEGSLYSNILHDSYPPGWLSRCSDWATGWIRWNIFFGAAAQSVLWPSYSWCFYITHNDAPQSVALLWTSDQPVAETSTWQHATLTTDIHGPPPRAGLEPKNLSKRAATGTGNRWGILIGLPSVRSSQGWDTSSGSLWTERFAVLWFED